ncbi:hypothetical protein QYF61_022765 [Mycteria americana]|uniref:Uncharacterized protein n=1 Tax=Mycteria americana TaxID=33587 RepID=A0AAN7RTR7_MYCAM|nr:hypothetical protein QYF61_022765 [Mycteria americana]
MAETKCYGLTTVPIPHPSCCSGGGGRRAGSEIEPGKKRRLYKLSMMSCGMTFYEKRREEKRREEKRREEKRREEKRREEKRREWFSQTGPAMIIQSNCLTTSGLTKSISFLERVNGTSQFGIVSTLANGHSTLASRSLTEILNRTGPTTEPRGTPLGVLDLLSVRDGSPSSYLHQRDIFNWIRLLRAPSNLTLNVSRDEVSTASLGNLFQCFTTLIIKDFSLISSLNLLSFSLKPLTLVLLLQALLKILKGCIKVSPEPSLLQAEQPQLSQPFLIGEVLQPSHHFCGPPLDLLQQLHVFPVLRAPELDAVLQDTVGFLGCEHTLPAHVQLFIHQYPQVLLCRAALNSFDPQPLLTPGVAPTQVQDLALGLVEHHEVHRGPLLELVHVPVDGILSLEHVNCTTQLGVICKFVEGALDPTVCVTDEDIKQSKYGPLRDTTHH